MSNAQWEVEGLCRTRIVSPEGLVAVCDVEHPEYIKNAALIAAAPETARRLAETQEMLAESELRNDYKAERIAVLRDALVFCSSIIKAGGMLDISERMAYKKAQAALRPSIEQPQAEGITEQDIENSDAGR